MQETGFPDIATLVPHSGAMVLLDRVLAVDAENLCAELAIHAGSMFFDTEAGGVGSWVGMEYMAQAIAAHAGWLAQQRGETVKVGFLLGSRKYEAARPLFAVGDVLRVQVHRALLGENGLGAFECKIEVAGEVAATATITVFQPNNVNEFLQDGSAV
jgi:predicted hotdog family 3-hydroxylacyl-ACP dehydratase